jgi:hypothetical protein
MCRKLLILVQDDVLVSRYQLHGTEQNRTEQSRAEQRRAEQNRPDRGAGGRGQRSEVREQNRAKQNSGLEQISFSQIHYCIHFNAANFVQIFVAERWIAVIQCRTSTVS